MMTLDQLETLARALRSGKSPLMEWANLHLTRPQLSRQDYEAGIAALSEYANLHTQVLEWRMQHAGR